MVFILQLSFVLLVSCVCWFASLSSGRVDSSKQAASFVDKTKTQTYRWAARLFDPQSRHVLLLLLSLFLFNQVNSLPVCVQVDHIPNNGDSAASSTMFKNYAAISSLNFDE